jgi:hypothetical protein
MYKLLSIFLFFYLFFNIFNFLTTKKSDSSIKPVINKKKPQLKCCVNKHLQRKCYWI